MGPPEVETFLHQARAFQSLIHSATELERDELLSALALETARTYAAGLALPRGEALTDDIEQGGIPQSPEIENLLLAKLGELNEFTDVFNPIEPERDDPITRSLAQELREISEDLQETIALLEKRTDPDALWEARWALDNHWGAHAVAVLRPLHELQNLHGSK